MKNFLFCILFFSIVSLFLPISVFSDTVIMTMTIPATSTPPSPSPGTPPPPSSGGGGGGGITIPQAILTQAIFKGRAYPGSAVSLTRDGNLVATSPAGPDAFFEIRASNLHTGTYTFGLSAKDINGITSLLQTFTISITEGASTLVSGIFIPPTISITDKQIKKGDTLIILGQTAPEAQITIFVNSEKEIVDTATSDIKGIWLYKLNTALLEYGDHSTKALAKKDQDVTGVSSLLNFKVGSITIPLDKKATTLIGDINGDGRVDLIDFSIMAFWYKKVLPADIQKKVDLNNDGKVDLVDFSILAYYWTG